MNILYITHSYYPAFRLGGPSKSIHLLNKHLVQKGINVSVLTTNAGLEHSQEITLNRWITQDGVNIKYFNYCGNKLYNVSPSILTETYNIISDFDIVHLSPVWNFPTLVGSLISYIKKKPYIISPRGTLYEESFNIKSTLLKKLYYKVFVKKIINNAKALHYTSEDEMVKVRSYLKIYNSNSFVIPNGIEIADFNNLPTKGYFRKKHSISDNIRCILFLGRIHYKKGLELLIHSFKEIINEGQADLLLVLAGFDNDGYQQKLIELIAKCNLENRVKFTGPLNGREIPEAFVDAELFVLPSYSENFGMSVIESMICGCPVVISDKVGLSEEIKKSNAGLVVNLNVQSIKSGITTLLGSKLLKNNISSNAKKLVKDKFDINNVAADMVNQYNLILSAENL
jgi:glycosyltransferase involved in cell wall biosynthesis